MSEIESVNKADLVSYNKYETVPMSIDDHLVWLKGQNSKSSVSITHLPVSLAIEALEALYTLDKMREGIENLSNENKAQSKRLTMNEIEYQLTEYYGNHHIYSIWKHLKTGHNYVLLGFSFDVEMQECCVQYRTIYGRFNIVFTRSTDEFFSKFKHVRSPDEL